MDAKSVVGIIIALIVGLAMGYGLTASRTPVTETTTIVQTTTKTSTVTNTITETETKTITETMMTSMVTTGKEVEYTIKLAYNPKIGFYLVDREGRTLYFFAKDYDGKSRCYGDCVARWPPFYVEDINPSPGLDKNDFKVVMRDDGTKQVAYKGWPLYYFFKDDEPGDIYGDGIRGVWFVAKPDYTVMIAVKDDLGPYLVTTDGMTLYFFAKDTEGKSNCYGPCAERWPVYSPSSLVIPSTLNITDFNFIARDDGMIQLVYKGHPLYLWINDAARGDTTGHGVNNVWFVASITGELP